MTFRQMEYVVEVADQGSISVAARKLMISQPSLSQTIKSIESEFNITLFDRSAIPLVPTKAGTVFLNKAHIMLHAMEDLKKELSLTANMPQELHIGISDSAALINKHIFSEFREYYPDLKLYLVERDQYVLERMLEAGKLDMIFTMMPYDNPNLDVFSLVEDELLIALPKEHPVSSAAIEAQNGLFDDAGNQIRFPAIDMNACCDVRFVLSGRDRLKFTQMSVLRTAFEPRISFETDSLASAVSLAAFLPHGTIVPMLYSSLYDGVDRPLFFRCSDALPKWSFALSLQKNAPISEAGQCYIRLFATYIETLGLLKRGMSAEGLLHVLKKINIDENKKSSGT